MFEREWREEARLFHRHDAFRRPFDEAEANSHRYSEDEEAKAQNTVIARWQERGLWKPSWGRLWSESDSTRSETFIRPEPGMSWASVGF
jgi:hypothetical protein